MRWNIIYSFDHLIIWNSTQGPINIFRNINVFFYGFKVFLHNMHIFHIIIFIEYLQFFKKFIYRGSFYNNPPRRIKKIGYIRTTPVHWNGFCNNTVAYLFSKVVYLFTIFNNKTELRIFKELYFVLI